jgi:hypothetical protein
MKYKIILPEGKEHLRDREGIAEFFTAGDALQTESVMRRLRAIVPDISFEIVPEE